MCHGWSPHFQVMLSCSNLPLPFAITLQIWETVFSLTKQLQHSRNEWWQTENCNDDPLDGREVKDLDSLVFLTTSHRRRCACVRALTCLCWGCRRCPLERRGVTTSRYPLTSPLAWLQVSRRELWPNSLTCRSRGPTARTLTTGRHRHKYLRGRREFTVSVTEENCLREQKIKVGFGFSAFTLRAFLSTHRPAKSSQDAAVQRRWCTLYGTVWPQRFQGQSSRRLATDAPHVALTQSSSALMHQLPQLLISGYRRKRGWERSGTKQINQPRRTFQAL